MGMQQYVVVYEQTTNNWCAYVPDLAGCVATAATREEVEKTIGEAVAVRIAGPRADNAPLPEPGVWTGVVELDEAQPMPVDDYSLAKLRAQLIRSGKALGG